MAINDCCKKPENLKLVAGKPGDTTVLRICEVCKRRHFEVVAQPGKFGLKGTSP